MTVPGGWSPLGARAQEACGTGRTGSATACGGGLGFLDVPGVAGGHVRAWWGTLGLKDVARYLQGQHSLRTVLDFSVSVKDEL